MVITPSNGNVLMKPDPGIACMEYAGIGTEGKGMNINNPDFPVLAQMLMDITICNGHTQCD